MSAGRTRLFDFFLVGGSHRELVVAGPAASATVAMEAAAATGQILMSKAMAASLPAASSGRSQGPGILLKSAEPVAAEGSPRTPADAGVRSSDRDLADLIPRALRQMVLAEGGGAEHRTATIAFIHFHGVDALIDSGGGEAAIILVIGFL
jgi:hypothetical protein